MIELIASHRISSTTTNRMLGGFGGLAQAAAAALQHAGRGSERSLRFLRSVNWPAQEAGPGPAGTIGYRLRRGGRARRPTGCAALPRWGIGRLEIAEVEVRISASGGLPALTQMGGSRFAAAGVRNRAGKRATRRCSRDAACRLAGHVRLFRESAAVTSGERAVPSPPGRAQLPAPGPPRTSPPHLPCRFSLPPR